MQRIVSGGISLALGGIWWLIDKLWGDAIFARISPMVPNWAANPPFWTLLDWTLSNGPPFVLVGVGIYFIISGHLHKRAEMTPATGASDLMRDYMNGKLELALPKTLPKILELSVGTDTNYYDIPTHNPWLITKRYKVKLRNTHAHRTVRNGKIQITDIDPPCGYRSPWLIAENITLSGGDFAYFPIASYDEVLEPTKCTQADSFITIETLSKSIPLLGIEAKHLIGIEAKHLIKILATAEDVRFGELKCWLWVDKDGKFQIEEE